MADQQQLELLKRSVKEWNVWRQLQQPYFQSDPINATLSGTNLNSQPDLINATLSRTNLSHADLSYANLSMADLSMADLNYANLDRANLSEANLYEADLLSANLQDTNLSRTNLTGAHFWNTLFVRIDLSTVKGLETVIHFGPSAVDINSVTLPKDEHTRLDFLRGVGFTETQIEYLPSSTH
jgi:uncharacterized protein YjbI with pentapeptide repeats